MAHDGVKQGYETTADTDAARESHFEGIDYLKRFGKLIERGKTVLDAGCGDGLPADAYLVKQGFAVNGIDVSARSIELARKNVPEGFFEVKDMLDLKEGEYCVDGVLSLHAMLRIPREKYRILLKNFASFMSNGGVLLLAMASGKGEGTEEGDHGATMLWSHDEADSNAELIENVGFTIVLNGVNGPGDRKHQILLARS